MTQRIKQSTVEASEWFAVQREGELGRADRGRFIDWLRESPAHVEEYLELARLWDEMGETDALQQVDVEAELAKAQDTVRDLDGARIDGGRIDDNPAGLPKARASEAPRAALSIAAGLLIAVAAAWWAGLFEAAPGETMSTAVGEQRSVTLEDGSLISLNTQTSIRVSVAGDVRRVDLLEGEVLFDIARDEQRPFVVVAGKTEVRVLGTSFNVYRQDRQTAIVTVLEGRVAVSGSQTAAEANGSAVSGSSTANVELTQGQQARVGLSGAVTEPEAVNVDKAVAWTDRRLIFENTTLAAVLAEFNRYNTQELRVADPELAALQLNGVFESHDPDSLLLYLERSYGVRVHDDGKLRILELP